MTGGTVVVLGSVGRNFAAGMSGGVAYVWDPDARFPARCNRNGGKTALEPVTDEADVAELKTLIERHVQYTRSDRGASLLQNWSETQSQFVKVVSLEYRQIQQELAAAKAGGKEDVADQMPAGVK